MQGGAYTGTKCIRCIHWNYAIDTRQEKGKITNKRAWTHAERNDMPKNNQKAEKIQPRKGNGAWVMLGLFAFTLLMAVALSALALYMLAPDPTIAPDVVEQAAAATLQVAVPIYVDETVNSILPGFISGTLTASAPGENPIPPAPILPTPPPIPCDLAGFVADQTIPDGARLSASTAFTKVWTVRNLGSCTWAADYALVFLGGESMAGQSPVTIGKELAPDDQMEISVNLVVPANNGAYSAEWMLQNSDGGTFGLFPNNRPLTLHISVGSVETVALDMTNRSCNATWSSRTGDMECPHPDDFTGGAVNPVGNTMAEYGMGFELPAIEVIPNEGADGVIRGTYELLQIQKGDTFNAIIGCADDQPECNLVFELQYDAGDHIPITLGGWTEKTDGAFQKVSVDLSLLEGTTVHLILSVTSANGTSINNKGIWISPVIFRTTN